MKVKELGGQAPWGYTESFIVCGALFLIGMLGQLLLGKCELSFLAFPVNIALGALYILSLLLVYLFARRRAWVRWMSSYQAALSAMLSVVLLTVVMGLIRQTDSHLPTEGDWLGFSQMLSAYPFVLLFFWMTTVLGMTTLRRIHHFRWRDIPFVLNHLGLFLALVGAVLGNADMRRLTMTTQVGKAEWRAFDEQQEMHKIPLSIELQSFTIDEYPPKLMLVDNETGKALPEDNPAALLIEDDFRSGQLQDWKITVQKTIPMAVCVATPDTVRFVESYSAGAGYALHLKATNSRTATECEGWVSGCSYTPLRLNEHLSLVMPDREPRRFASAVRVHTASGRQEAATIEVNKPFEVEGWKIYQLGYDQSKGRWSDISVFELVRDPWLPVVYAGIWMMIAGAVCLLALPKTTRKEGSGRWNYKWMFLFGGVFSLVLVCHYLFRSHMYAQPLMPALQSPWFAPHVVVYMFAYTLLGAATVMAVCLLLLNKKPADERRMRLCDALVSMGLSFMTLGMLFGAVWAKEAWGHYWNWDPKETWAAATWIGYLCYIHFRMHFRHQPRVALIGLLVCFALLQMCWYGINYLPAAQGASVHMYDLN